MPEKHIIDYESIFENENKQMPVIKSGKRNALIVLIIYAAFVLFNFISALGNTGNTEIPLLFQVLEQSDNQIILVLDKEEKDNNLDNFEKYQTFTYLYEGNTYYLASKSNFISYELFESLLLGEESNYKIIYSDDQIISNYAVDNNNFIPLYNFINYMALAIANLVIFLILLIPITILLLSDLKEDYLKFKDSEYGGMARVLNSIFAMFIVSIGSGLIVMGLSKVFNFDGVSDNQKQIEAIFSTNAKYIMFLSVVIVAPLLEELVFRKAIFKMFNNKKLALIVSSVSFGLIHLVSESVGLINNGFTFIGVVELLVMSIAYISMGVYLSYVYKKHEENIMVPILLHAFVNFISGISLLF